MASEEASSISASGASDGITDFGASGSHGVAAAAAAAAAASVQLSGSSTTAEIATNHAVHTLFLVDFTYLKAGNITELVEVAWVVFDVPTRQSIEEMSMLVRPEQLLAPAETLTSLGVTQEQLCMAPPFGEVVQKLDSAVFRKCQEIGKPAMLCVFGLEKLREFRQCASARQVSLFTHYAHVVDLKIILEQFMNFKGDDMRNMGTAAGALHLAAPEGREEGLAACRCMCGMLFLLLSKGLTLAKEHCINVDNAYAVGDASKSPAQTATGGLPGLGTHLRLRGLPWDVTEDAVVRFLKPVVTIAEADVCVCLGLNKRVTGEAYVNTHSTDLRDLAVRTLHGRMMGQRWIEIFRATAEDFERAMQRRVAVLSSDTRDGRDADVKGLNLTILKLRGLPWSCSDADIVSFFQEHGFEISPESVVLGVAIDGRMNGIAYVELPDSATADAAKEKLHRKYLGRRFVEVYPSTREEMSRAKRPGRMVPAELSIGAMRIARPARIMGASAAQGPYSAAGGYGAAPQAYGAMGAALSTAQGYALEGMGGAAGGYGAYGPASHDVYGGGGAYGASPSQAAYAQPPQVVQSTPVQDVGPPPAGWSYNVLRLRGMPFNANEQHIVQFFQGLHMTAILPSTIPIDGRPSGEAYVQFADVNETWRAMQTRNGARMDRRYIELFPASKQEMAFAAQGGDPRAFRERERLF